MKNRFLIVGLFAMVLAIGAMCFIGASDDVVYATENSVTAVTPEGVDYIVEKHTNISAYRALENGYYQTPSIQTETTGEWVFAGWYKDAACSEAVKKSSGEAYAKFVSADVLSVKCQISTDTTPESDSTLLRCISSVDTLKYSFVGFDLITPAESKNMESSKVGTRIQVTEDKKSNPCNYSPKVVDTESEYFFSAVETINKDDFAKGFLIKPYWITKDGTKVYGVSKYVTISDALNKTAIYISVKKTTEPTGTFTVNESTAECVKYDADGDYAHLKYDVNSTTLGSVTKLQVTGDANATIYYRNLNTKYTGSNADQSWYKAYEGTSEDEFVIATNADLYGLSAETTEVFTGKTIYLCADIEANKGIAASTGWDKTQVTDGTDYKWTPIRVVFNGTFDGQGHTISGIYADESSRTAMFEWTNSQSCIQNFNLLNSYFKNTSSYTGSIVGRVSGRISNVYSNAIINGQSYGNGGIAGFVYKPQAVIENCHFAGQLYSTGTMAGGILGSQYSGKAIIDNCTVSGTISSDNTYVGGIFGTSYVNEFGQDVDVEISECTITSAASVNGTGDHIGGLVAYIAKGNLNITSTSFGGQLPSNTGLKGGLVGKVEDGTVTIGDSSFVGTMNATNYAGGFVGRVIDGTVTINESESNGTITATGYYVGGLVGQVDAGIVNIDDSNFAGEMNVTQSAGGLVGYVTGGQVTIDGSSFAGEVEGTWAIGGLVGRVKNGTVQIVNNSNFEQTGKLTGRTYTGGCVGYVESGNVTINSSGVTGTVSTTGQYTGGLVGSQANGEVTIQDCYSSATFSAKDYYAGGLVGAISGGTNTTIENSYFSGSLTGKAYVGGILGNVSSDVTINIKKCYSSGTVTGSVNGIGGILGYITAGTVNMENCLNKGSVNTNDGGAGGLVGRTSGGTVSINYCLNRGTITGPHLIGSVVGWKQSGTVNATSVYATKTSTATAVGVSNKLPYSNVPIGNTNSATYTGVTMIELNSITVSETVSDNTIMTQTLSGLFGPDTVWIIGTTAGSRPELNFN